MYVLKEICFFALHFLPIQEHPIDFINCLVGSIFSFEMNESITFAVSIQIACNFAAKDIAEHGKSIVNCLCIDMLVQILDENVSCAGSTNAWVALGPHDANWLVHHHVEVHRVQCTLS